jgi:hypothetical protein
MQRKRITRQRSGVIVNNLLPLLLCRIRRETRAPAAFAAKASTTAKQYEVLKIRAYLIIDLEQGWIC